MGESGDRLTRAAKVLEQLTEQQPVFSKARMTIRRGVLREPSRRERRVLRERFFSSSFPRPPRVSMVCSQLGTPKGGHGPFSSSPSKKSSFFFFFGTAVCSGLPPGHSPASLITECCLTEAQHGV